MAEASEFFSAAIRKIPKAAKILEPPRRRRHRYIKSRAALSDRLSVARAAGLKLAINMLDEDADVYVLDESDDGTASRRRRAASRSCRVGGRPQEREHAQRRSHSRAARWSLTITGSDRVLGNARVETAFHERESQSGLGSHDEVGILDSQDSPHAKDSAPVNCAHEECSNRKRNGEDISEVREHAHDDEGRGECRESKRKCRRDARELRRATPRRTSERPHERAG
ncbi:hypothetical protein FQA39_LY19351 [Lamprigera yunnana]|nr:hypothetical protein FQA39_LY19351 [Lamprigera yunnana]